MSIVLMFLLDKAGKILKAKQTFDWSQGRLSMNVLTYCKKINLLFDLLTYRVYWVPSLVEFFQLGSCDTLPHSSKHIYFKFELICMELFSFYWSWDRSDPFWRSVRRFCSSSFWESWVKLGTVRLDPDVFLSLKGL